MTTDASAFSFIQSLPTPEVIEEVPYDVLLQEMVGANRARLPNWDANPESVLYKSLEVFAFYGKTFFERVNSSLLQGMIAYATGTNLDNLAALTNTSRREGETDDDFRVRIPTTIASRVAGTITYFVENAKIFNPAIVDVQIQLINSTFIEVRIYAIKAGGGSISAAERTALVAYFNRDDVRYLGAITSARATTVSTYGIAINLTFDSRETDEDTMVSRVRTALYDYVDEYARLNTAIYPNKIGGIAENIDGVLNWNVTQPAAVRTAGISKVNFCRKEESNVVITTTDIAP